MSLVTFADEDVGEVAIVFVGLRGADDHFVAGGEEFLHDGFGGSAGGGGDLPRFGFRLRFRHMSTREEIELAALRLSDQDRLKLADKILASLPRPPVPAEDDEILAEAVRRDAELESGKTMPLSEAAFWQGVRHSRG